MIKFTIVHPECGDWEALYVNGKLAAEGHMIRAIDVLDAISDIIPNSVEAYEIPDEIAEYGMPTNLSDIFNDYNITHVDDNAENMIEVVRCKDCDVPHNKWTGCPKLGGLVTPPDFYCAFGYPKV